MKLIIVRHGIRSRADAVLRAQAANSPRPFVIVTHGHFSRILAARALGLAAGEGRLFASSPASVSVIEDHHNERCIGPWNLDPTLLTHTDERPSRPTRERLS